MSHEAYHWALRQDVPPTERFVLSILADRSNHEGVSWPGKANLAELTGFTPRTVQRAVARLEELGLLEIEARLASTGRTTSNLYRLRLDHGRTLLEIVTAEQQWRSARSGQAVLFASAEPLEGEGDRVSPSPEAPPLPVHNPVDKSSGLSTGETEDLPQGDRVSPTEGDRGSPLELKINQDPLTPSSTTATSTAVDNIECSDLAVADTRHACAPDGAEDEEVRQDEGGAIPVRTDIVRRLAETRFALVDDAFRRRYGAAWVKRAGGTRRQAWLSVLTTMSAEQVQRGIDEALKWNTPQNAHGFAMLACVPRATPEHAPVSWPPSSRDVGHTHLALLKQRLLK